MGTIQLSPGHPLPLGASKTDYGINFAVYSSKNTPISLLIFKSDSEESTEYPLDPDINKTGDIWHIHISDIILPVTYNYLLKGENISQVSDPYAKILTGGESWGSTEPRNFKSVIRDTHFNWEDDQAPNISLSDSVIYEMHIRGFTQHPSAHTNKPGTISGLIEKIPYLQDLGITAIELLPVTEFDETALTRTSPSGKRLINFWGYDPINFFAVKAGYAHTEDQISEFKSMVKSFHKAGIEVILDVVFNHTGEGAHLGKVYNLRGLGNSTYYILDPKNNEPLNFSGCGNSVNANHPVVSDLIIDALRYWVIEMHVDGFRFDLASVLCRSSNGTPLTTPPVIDRITKDPVLSKVKLIAEAWDAAGLYQVGTFPAQGRWAEWNGLFRDDIRRYVKGEAGVAPIVATRLSGSADLYRTSNRAPYHSINFITSHDGFTMADLVSYSNKHNLDNGENNRDGSDHNLSWNCGVEGPTSNSQINSLRKKQIKNFFTLLFLAQGVPMLLAGDEIGRSQQGNNNTYCQDNATGWIDWGLFTKNNDIHRFVKMMIAFRMQNETLRRTIFFEDDPDQKTSIHWHGKQLFKPDWSQSSRQLAFHLLPLDDVSADIFVMSNSSPRKIKFHIPEHINGSNWYRFVDTDLLTPNDICSVGNESLIDDQTLYFSGAHSTIILVSK